VDQDWIGVDGQAPIWVDVRELECAYESALEAPTGALEPLLREGLRSAAGLYRGELLEGWYHDWCVDHRDAYRSMHLALLYRLMVDAEATESWEVGLAYGRRALQEDRASERVHALMMRLHLMGGDRTAALRQYDLCEAALRADLGVEAQDSTRRLYERIRDHGTAGPANPPTPRREPADAVLRELRRSLSVLQEEVAVHLRVLDGLSQ
jgi:DNA-binding SARP family transcriptional activator